MESFFLLKSLQLSTFDLHSFGNGRISWLPATNCCKERYKDSVYYRFGPLYKFIAISQVLYGLGFHIPTFMIGEYDNDNASVKNALGK